MDSIVSVSIGTDAYRYYQRTENFSRKEVHELFKYLSYLTDFDGTSNYTVRSFVYDTELKAFKAVCYANDSVSAIVSLEKYFLLFDSMVVRKDITSGSKIADMGSKAIEFLDDVRYSTDDNEGNMKPRQDISYFVVWISSSNWDTSGKMFVGKFVEDRHHAKVGGDVKKAFSKPETISGKAKKAMNIVWKIVESFDGKNPL